MKNQKYGGLLKITMINAIVMVLQILSLIHTGLVSLEFKQIISKRIFQIIFGLYSSLNSTRPKTQPYAKVPSYS